MLDDTKQGASIIGPFTDEEIEGVARQAVVGLGVNWDGLKADQKIGLVGETKEILLGRNVTPRFTQLLPGSANSLGTEFKALVLQEFRNSPKWDEADFSKGYRAPHMAQATTEREISRSER